jgi:hypothetical protein
MGLELGVLGNMILKVEDLEIRQRQQRHCEKSMYDDKFFDLLMDWQHT